MQAARRRLERDDELHLTAAWLGARLTRAKKFPALKKILRGKGKEDVGAYLDGLKQKVPRVRLSELLARRGAAE